MHTNSCYPPYIYLCQVADHIPHTLKTYLYLFRTFEKHNLGDDTALLFSRDTIENVEHMNWKDFCRDLQSLAYEGLIDCYPTDKKTMSVTLFHDYSINAEGYSLC